MMVEIARLMQLSTQTTYSLIFVLVTLQPPMQPLNEETLPESAIHQLEQLLQLQKESTQSTSEALHGLVKLQIQVNAFYRGVTAPFQQLENLFITKIIRKSQQNYIFILI
ncbi:hypothetical protein TTHERM_000275929 (macronuclear) [Tetrahymena thermophila SB210]|uniref:Uncharacterized protein n=1 Tax=Tetrahymena thermophila (strain SB210) TaxID=312017 RepID=W7X4Y7_TETTS|nr:hypothetical protein TTHERM_000275929 [Tetrahymena thermophila SB210]EWS74415.1 hypothetical protein TTHERM_000275929 [Tetrahymena thermophila SB210]|eukprot:XP_012653092.1 hypothetical protein TTHERM_000275929 [Tetrahymena thermophila SB210]